MIELEKKIADGIGDRDEAGEKVAPEWPSFAREKTNIQYI